ncbi:MAG: Minf_1886 family protein [Limisphaerales bacterium]
MQSSLDVEDTLDKIVAKDGRFDRDAYYFVRDALDVAQKKFCKTGREPQHVSGQQLLQGIRQHAIDEFGPLTLTVLEHWGITQCSHFGDIVFNMVDESLLGKTDEDERSDFADGYDFDEAFRQPFLPKQAKKSSDAPAKPKEKTKG